MPGFFFFFINMTLLSMITIVCAKKGTYTIKQGKSKENKVREEQKRKNLGPSTDQIDGREGDAEVPCRQV